MKKSLGILVAASAMGFVMSGATSATAAERFPPTSEQIKAKAEGRCLNPSCTAISQKKPDVKTGGSPTKEYDRRGNEITDAFKEGRATLPHSASQERAAKVAQEKEAAAKKNKEFSDRADAQRRTAELARAKSEEKRREQVKWGACTANGFKNCGPKPKP